ncbi:MAG: radical SAM peptide maturase [Bacteroidetes bacterium]|nr:radical SAM peptide maturase [Bacteroidota bacterium]
MQKNDVSKMRSTFLLKSKNNNHYLFDKKLKELKAISKAEYENFDKIESASNEKVSSFFSRKCQFLKDHGYFGRIDNLKKFSGRLSLDNVKYNIANLTQLVFEVTDRCNLNCTYCAYGSLYCDYDIRHNINLSFNEGKKIIDYIIKQSKTNYANLSSKPLIISFYGGEPLLNFEFIEKTVHYVNGKEFNRPVSFSMTTNGLLIHKHLDFLVKHNFNLLISLDGNEEGNSYRVFKNDNKAFSEIKRNIDIIAERYPQYFKEKVNFNAVLHNRNSVISIMNYVKSTYNKIPRIAPLNDSGIRETSKKEFEKMFKVIDEQELSKNEKYRDVCKDLFLNLPSFTTISTFLLNNTSIFKNSINNVLLDRNETGYIPTGTCTPFSKKMFVTVNKKIMFCERISQNYFAGFIDNMEEGLASLVEKYNEYIQKLESQCQKCYNNDSCSLCMYYIENLDDKPVCKHFTSKEKYKNYLEAVFTYLENNEQNILRIKNEVVID